MKLLTCERRRLYVILTWQWTPMTIERPPALNTCHTRIYDEVCQLPQDLQQANNNPIMRLLESQHAMTWAVSLVSLPARRIFVTEAICLLYMLQSVTSLHITCSILVQSCDSPEPFFRCKGLNRGNMHNWLAISANADRLTAIRTSRMMLNVRKLQYKPVAGDINA